MVSVVWLKYDNHDITLKGKETLQSQTAGDMAALNQDFPQRQSLTYSVVHDNKKTKSKKKETKLLSPNVPLWFCDG